MKYRFATAEDCLLLAELNHQLIRDEGPSESDECSAIGGADARFHKKEYRAVIFEDNDEIVAYALFREQPGEIYLRQLFVVRNRRREGIGRQAMEILRSKIWPKTKRLTVEVLVGNKSAVAFWRAIGFVDYTLTLEIIPGD